MNLSLDELHIKICPDLRKCFRPAHLRALDVLRRVDIRIQGKDVILECVEEIFNRVEFSKSPEYFRKKLFPLAEIIRAVLLRCRASSDFEFGPAEVKRIEFLLSKQISFDEIIEEFCRPK